ncbi:MAG: DUF2147 domain-containing protein [Alphaproteobacteria bacterium]|nr:DUF2147 domain-containing protein [Alphaproteobacteria bacterium]
MRRILLAVSLSLLGGTSWAQQPSVLGTWLTASGKAQVRIEPCADPKGGPICGFVVGLIQPRGPDGVVVAPEVATDFRNTDPTLRSRKVLGMPLIWGFKKSTEPNAFEDGQIYNGENGKVYSANISLQPDGKLRLRGYVGSPMFGETQLWTRVN